MLKLVSKRSVSGIISSSAGHRNVAAPFLSSIHLSTEENDVKCNWYSAMVTGRSNTGVPKTPIDLRNGPFLGSRYELTAASTYQYQAEVAHSTKSDKPYVWDGAGNAPFYLKRDDIGFAHPKWLQNLLVKNYSQVAGKEVEADVSKMEGQDGIGNSNLSSSSSNNILRPLSPHLPVYMPQVTSTSSILHRISWCLLTFMVLSSYFLCLKMGLVCFTYAAFYDLLFAASKLILISAEMSALAMIYLVVHLFV